LDPFPSSWASLRASGTFPCLNAPHFHDFHRHLSIVSPGSAGGYPPAPPQTRTHRFPAYYVARHITHTVLPMMVALDRGRDGACRLRAFRVSVYPGPRPDSIPSPGSSLPYSQAPAVSVRLLSTGTMKLLRLPSVSRLTLRIFQRWARRLVVDFTDLLVQAGKSATCTPGCC
jgi:hypothetical protein